jgi:hypothetical protein
LDALEQAVEPLWGQLAEALFQPFRTLDVGAAQECLNSLRAAVNDATRSQQGFFNRLFWFAHRAKRFEQLGTTTCDTSGRSVPVHRESVENARAPEGDETGFCLRISQVVSGIWAGCAWFVAESTPERLEPICTAPSEGLDELPILAVSQSSTLGRHQTCFLTGSELSGTKFCPRKCRI